MIDSILKLFGWFCNPAEALPVPTKKATQKKSALAVPDNISFDGAGKPFETVHRKDGLDARVVTIGRTASRTKFDDMVLSVERERGRVLSANKYFKLKAFWARGLSAKQTARALQAERGFGIRTVEMYWTAFGETQRIEHDRGVRHSPTVLEFA